MEVEIELAGLSYAAEKGITKLCPKDGGTPMLFAGDGLHDYEIICNTCGFTVNRNSLKATIERWNVATEKAKSE